jgi:hypothetical protein
MPSGQALLIAAVVVIVLAVIVWLATRHPTPPSGGCKTNAGDPGTCNFDKDCNSPNGACYKDAAGVCGCVCSPGYSGVHCETKGVPWNSPHCMGPNTKWPARKDKNGMCVCPPGNWAAGVDPKTGYVQCLKCAGDWGPLSGDTPCAQKWLAAQYLTQNCYTAVNYDPCAAAAEYGYVLSQTGPGGVKGSAASSGSCLGTQSCHCTSSASGATQAPCNVTGWLDPARPNEGCDPTTAERACSSYKCLYS